ncbi:MAG TPA: hypothetical protein VMJ35_06320 [Dongiaceae bacterium]|nr:hypothetical protein [Dongiaceae bacterium]
MKPTLLFPALFFVGCATLLTPAQVNVPQNWTHTVRIGAYGLKTGNADTIVRDAQNSHVFGIEVDNDIPGRYESYLDPTEKLKAIRAVAVAAHHAGNRAFVYIAGTECITAHADNAPHSVMKDHPEWVQRKITGEPALFTSGAAFWIAPGDEDVWISPYAKDWRKTYMERVRQIAGTGIDGIYVDIPYWMTHFDGWEDSWASFDDATVAAFRAKTGLDAKKELKIGDFDDPNFRKWIDFRIDTMTEFMREIRDTARSVKPDIMVIPEIYPGIEREATVVGADVYQIYGVVDAIAHEYEFGNGEHMAASRTLADWFLYQAGMLSFRAFAEGKATWILNYSWDGNKGVDKREAMKNLASSIVMTGANFWDAPGHSMAGSNDPETRKQIFVWIEKNQDTLYKPREPMQPVGVYFSPKSRDYSPKLFLDTYRGALVALLQAHREFQVVTPRTLGKFHGECLVLPNVLSLSESEQRNLEPFLKTGGKVVVIGKEPAGLPAQAKTLHVNSDSISTYFETLEHNFPSAIPPADFLSAVAVKTDIRIDAPPTVATNFGRVNGRPHIFLANFSGLEPNKIAVPAPAKVQVTVPATWGNTLTFLPFLGEAQTVHGEAKGENVQFVLPPIERGAVVWAGDSPK